MHDKKFISERLQEVVSKISCDFDSIAKSRREELSVIASYLITQLEDEKPVKLIFICTHNSRRSHLGQIWAQVAAYFYGIPIECYSGGTEATAFNPRALEAMRRSGFSISGEESDDNPFYEVRFNEHASTITAFSKKYSDTYNPQSAYAAIMTCSDADENCPVVLGADTRFSLTYMDPKDSDDTPGEAETYDLRSYQIAREMFYMLSLVASKV